MDKLTPVIQDTPVTVKVDEEVSSWYSTEVTSGQFTKSQLAWMHAQGWTVTHSSTINGNTLSSLQRRIISPESVLADLVTSYTDAYNSGRQLNDQRYDDILVLYAAVLDKTENSYNTLETGDTTYEALVEGLLTSIDGDYTAYAADVDGDMDTWGVGLLAEINARFDAELAKAQSSLVDRGMYSTTMWTTISAGIERERTRALNDANDKINERQLGLKHKVYAAQVDMRLRLLAARDRLRVFMHGAKDKQVAVRNSAVEMIARIIEARTDSYPSIAQIGQLANSLGAGSAESYAP